jgi:hypothetical protein
MPKFFRFLLALFLALPLSLVETTPAALAAPLAWELIPPLDTARESLTTTLLAYGRVLVACGYGFLVISYLDIAEKSAPLG